MVSSARGRRRFGSSRRGEVDNRGEEQCAEICVNSSLESSSVSMSRRMKKKAGMPVSIIPDYFAANPSDKLPIVDNVCVRSTE
jgi:hypothetical protein